MTTLGAPFDQQGVHLLIDPDKWTGEQLDGIVMAVRPPVRSLIVGGTYIHSGRTGEVVTRCAKGGLPVGTFVGAGPVDSFLGNGAQFMIVPILLGALSTRFITDQLFQLVEAAERAEVNVQCVAYVPLDGGVKTAAAFFTQHTPLPRNRPELVALVGKVAACLGIRGLYLESGSGARYPVTRDEIAAARKVFKGTLLVGGGVRTPQVCTRAFEAGADAVVVGTCLEESRSLGWLHGLKVEERSSWPQVRS